MVQLMAPQEPLKNKLFVRCSSHFCSFGAKPALVSQNHSEPTCSYGVRPHIYPFGGTLALAASFRHPETAQKQSVSKAFVPFLSIWCKTGHGHFSASQHNVPQPSKRNWPQSFFGIPAQCPTTLKTIFRMAFVPFWSSWRQTGVPELLK